MNERHDALYNRARGVLNQNIKRLWFMVNPYLEKKDTLDAHPESPTRFIQPLQSTVLSESLLNHETQEHKQLEIDGFWDFLFSDKWRGHCSVRVMEGQLLETMMAVLHVLERDGEVIHKKTHAYARNERERRGCYRLANQEGCDTVQEILLLEFTYYGRRKPRPSQCTSDSSSGYPGNGSTTTTWPCASPSCPSGNEMLTSVPTFADTPKPQNVSKPSRRRRKSAPNIRKNVPKNTQRRLSRLPNTLEEEKANFDDDGQPDRNFLLEINDFQTTGVWNSQQSHISSESSDFRTTNSIVRNLSRLPCSERTSYMGNVMMDENDTSGENMNVNEVEELWEKMMYLSDIKSKTAMETVSGKLRRYMAEKYQAKKEMEEMHEEWEKRRISAFKPVSKYAEMDAEESSSSSGIQYRFLDCVPDFEDFLLILEEDSKFDPRFKRAKQISRKIAKRYNIARENISGLASVEVDQKKTNTVSRLPPISEKGTQMKKNFRTGDNKFRSSTKTPTGSRRISAVARSSVTSVHGSEKVDNEKTAHEVGVVTASKSCEKHVLEHYGRRSSHRASLCKVLPVKDAKKKKKTPDTAPSIYLTSPAGANYLLYQPASKKSDAKRKGTLHTDNTSGPIAEVEFEQDPSEKTKDNVYSSEDDQDDTTDFQNLFDSRKLNTKYSFERLRGKNYHKKKPAFFGVLKKYYKMQKVADAFSGRKSQRKSVFQRLLNKDKQKQASDTDIIGKLKPYNFLYHRERTRTEVDPCDFSSLSMDIFRANLVKALDDFVVRKERVVSNIGGKSSTHITFTKQSIFKHRE
ncbi:uncharacterized protein LOC132561567 [Ylistrum balloti]|uniref:uncharacterized protein LOC132561567 n=1 Tax=Ylistrum balloti TaxID=509963 RepID=UPI002905C98D|nr:uncharacterized protein LOC132561567 [Ylistrum balloti]